MMGKDNFNFDMQKAEQRPAPQRIGFAKLQMMIHEHAPTMLTKAKEEEKKIALDLTRSTLDTSLLLCQALP